MAQTYRYIDTYGSTFNVDLGNSVIRLGTLQGFTECANVLEVGTAGVIFDDVDANLGHSGDAILGLKTFVIDESDEAVNNRRMYTGTITDRTYARGDSEHSSLITGRSRTINANLTDLNGYAAFRLITGTDGNRPAETVGARITWLLGSAYFLPNDHGFVDYPTSFTMDAADYRSQTPGDVLADCMLAVSYNAFIYWYEPGNEPALWFKDSNTSTDYTSTLSLSGVLSDLSPNNPFATVWGITDAVLNRSPDHVYAGVEVPYAAGSVYVTRSSTADNFGWRDGVAPNSNAKTAARATNDGNRFLNLSASEEDRIAVSVELPSHMVNHIRAGHRIPFKAPWLPGYEDYVNCRVLRRTVKQTVLDPLLYTLDLDLSPQENPGLGDNLLFAVINMGGPGALPEPADLSGHPWTKAFWTGNYASAGQFPGPGGAGSMGIWYRLVSAGESGTPVITVQNSSLQALSVWVYQVRGGLVSGITSNHGIDTVTYPGEITISSPVAASPSYYFGAWALQKVNYGQYTVLHNTTGSGIDDVTGQNQATAGLCGLNDGAPPTMHMGYATGSGTLVNGATFDCCGSGPGCYNLYGRGWGGLLFTAVAGGSLSVVQRGFGFAVGADVAVSLSSAP